MFSSSISPADRHHIPVPGVPALSKTPGMTELRAESGDGDANLGGAAFKKNGWCRQAAGFDEVVSIGGLE